MEYFKGVVTLFIFIAVMTIGGYYLAQTGWFTVSFLPPPHSVDAIPRAIVKAYRTDQSAWPRPSSLSLRYCTNGFNGVYKFTVVSGGVKQDDVFDTSGTVLAHTEIRGDLPEDNKVPPSAMWYRLYSTCTDLAPLFEQ